MAQISSYKVTLPTFPLHLGATCSKIFGENEGCFQVCFSVVISRTHNHGFLPKLRLPLLCGWFPPTTLELPFPFSIPQSTTNIMWLEFYVKQISALDLGEKEDNFHTVRKLFYYWMPCPKLCLWESYLSIPVLSNKIFCPVQSSSHQPCVAPEHLKCS